MCKFAFRNAGMKQDDVARVLNVSQSVVSRPLKEHRESDSITKRNGSALIHKCKELLLKHYQSSRKRRITRIGTHIFSLGRMIFDRQEFRVRMFF